MAVRKKKDPGELTPKQKRFVEEYLVDLNGKQAAIRVGYSPKTAEFQASRLLRNDKVSEMVQKAMDERSERTHVDADKVIRELARLGFSDMLDYSSFGPDGVALRNSRELNEDQARAISEVSQTVTKDGGSIKFKLHSKTDALQLLGRHLRLFIDRAEVTGKDGESLFPVWTDLVKAADKK